MTREENAEQIERFIGISCVSFVLFVIVPEIAHWIWSLS